jgi:hypothetical protein
MAQPCIDAFNASTQGRDVITTRDTAGQGMATDGRSCWTATLALDDNWATFYKVSRITAMLKKSL